MGIFLDGRFDTERQERGGARDLENSRLTKGWRLVLSSVNHARALAELKYLDGAAGSNAVHLQYESVLELARFYREAESLSREKPIQVVHAHDLFSAATALLARQSYQYRVILDYSSGSKMFPPKKGALLKTEAPVFGFRALEILEEWVLKNVNHLIVETRG